jgi:hypothetical protein
MSTKHEPWPRVAEVDSFMLSLLFFALPVSFASFTSVATSPKRSGRESEEVSIATDLAPASEDILLSVRIEAGEVKFAGRNELVMCRVNAF